MKKVFSSNSQLAHVWAQQNQDEGCTKSVFFHGTRIYSYGTHFLAAQIHIAPRTGRRLALVNSHRYSNTTSRHLCEIRSALSDLMPYFECSDPGSPSLAASELEAKAKALIPQALARSKVTSVRDLTYTLEDITNAYSEVNAFRELIGHKKRVKFEAQDRKEIAAHFAARLKRYQELNTPRALAKKAHEAEKRAERKAALEEKKLAERISKFRSGELSTVQGLEYALLRVDGDRVVTSRGAQVPLREAMRLYRAIENGTAKSEQQVGLFTFERIDDIDDSDRVVKIGCHYILLSEARQVLGAARSHLRAV